MLLRKAKNTNKVVQKPNHRNEAVIPRVQTNKEAHVQAADASLVAGEVAKLRDALRQSQQHVDSLMGKASSAATTQVTTQHVCVQCTAMPH